MPTEVKCPTHGKELIANTASDKYVCPVMQCEYELTNVQYDLMFMNAE